jgi:hypothetical protein
MSNAIETMSREEKQKWGYLGYHLDCKPSKRLRMSKKDGKGM